MNDKAIETFVTVSETMFPGITSTYNKKSPAIRLGSEIVSSLPLQVSLYLNVIYFPLWLCVLLMVSSVKFPLLNYLYQFVLVTVLVAFIIIEVVRLYLGYLGNLKERVPELAGFWLLSVLLQLPLSGFLLFNTDLILVPIERAVNMVMFVMISVELILGFFALRTMTKHQAFRFHCEQMVSPELEGYTNPAYQMDDKKMD